MYRRSVLLSWIGFYLLVFMVPTSFGAFLFLRTYRIAEEEIVRTNQSLMAVAQRTVDSGFSQLKQIAMEIALDNTFLRLIANTRPQSTSFKLNVEALRNRLKEYLLFNDLIYDILVYFKEHDTILSPAVKCSSLLYYETRYKNSHATYEAWRGLLSGTYLCDTVCMYGPADETQRTSTRKLIGIFYSLPFVGSMKRSVNLGLIVDPYRIVKEFGESRLETQTEFYIVDAHNNIFPDKALLTEGVRYDPIEKSGNGIATVEKGNNNVILISMPSQQLDLRFFLSVPESSFYERARRIKNFSLYSLFACIALGGLLMVFLAKRNYAPIDEIISYITNKTHAPYDGTSGELAFLKDSVQDVVTENCRINEIMEQQKKAIMSNFLRNLLKGLSPQNPPPYETQSYLGIQFITDYFAVMLFVVEGYDSNRIVDTSEPYYRSDVIRNLNTHMASEYVLFAAECDGMMACIINIRMQEGNSAGNRIKDIAESILQLIRKRNQIRISAGISCIHRTLRGISKAYREAINAIEYNIVMGQEAITYYDDIGDSSECTYHYPIWLEEKFLNAVSTGDTGTALAVIDEIYATNTRKVCMSVNIAKCLMFHLTSTILRALSVLDDELETALLAKFDPVGELTACANINRLRLEIETLIGSMCPIIQEKLNADKKTLCKKILEYIGKNICDINLSVDSVSYHFNRSRSYIFSLIKAKTGQGLHFHICAMRIQKAKELLETSDSSVSEIGRMVGYASASTFIRVFKHNEGVTPNLYRTLKRLS